MAFASQRSTRRVPDVRLALLGGLFRRILTLAALRLRKRLDGVGAALAAAARQGHVAGGEALLDDDGDGARHRY